MIDWLLAYVAVNCAVFLAFALDKHRALSGGWRIPERKLLTWSAFGWPGAAAGRRLLRHKTRKQPFASLFIAVMPLHLLLCALSLPPSWPLLAAALNAAA